MHEDEIREKRICDEIIVDTYGPEEQALGWYYYLEDKMTFPFRAKCIVHRTISPLEVGEMVQVVGMPSEEDCYHEMFVIIELQGRRMGVPLSQLEPVDADEETRTAVEDWHYWVAMGHQLV